MVGTRTQCCGISKLCHHVSLAELDVAATIHELRASVSVYDPAASRKAMQPRPQLEYVRSVEAAAYDADVVLLLTEWDEFRDIDSIVPAKNVSCRKWQMAEMLSMGRYGSMPVGSIVR